jgi:ADP-heptose:LPS heptosyltransferase
VLQEIIHFLNLEEVNTVYIGGKMELEGDPEFTDFRFMNQTIPELFSIIHGARMVISMDSSPRWVSHFTRTPLTAVLGPSRPEERLSLHPLLKTDVTALRLNEWIKCKPCFERAVDCNNKVTCFTRVKPEKVYEELRPSIMKYWRADE